MNLWETAALTFTVGSVCYAYGYGHAYNKWEKAFNQAVRGKK